MIKTSLDLLQRSSTTFSDLLKFFENVHNRSSGLWHQVLENLRKIAKYIVLHDEYYITTTKKGHGHLEIQDFFSHV